MKRFKQFLFEAVEDQIKTTQARSKEIGSDLQKSKTFGGFYGGKETIVGVSPQNPKTYGTYGFIPKNYKFQSGYVNPSDFHSIDISTDDRKSLSNPHSRESSTLRHELQHLHQKERQLKDNPTYALSRKNSTKFDKISGFNAYAQNYIDTYEVGKKLSYATDPQEVNARGIQRGGDAIIRHNDLARSKITSDSKFADFDFELEKSKGKAKPPTLDPNIGRSQANLAFGAEMGKENDSLNDLEKDLIALKRKDKMSAQKSIQTSRKAISSDIARGVQSNVGYAQEVAQDAYSDKVTGPQRERTSRVARTQADVETTKSARMAGGLGSGAFSSDPIAISNLGMDVAGAMGQSSLRTDQMKKAAASLYNPMYSDSEQMMGDALLRGGGEDFQVDPTFLRVSQQRAKDRQR